jgi:hypothetical protein
MADINVDVNLPSAINVDITSPTQALATNVSIPGPQGPRGEKGNPTSINSLTAENIIITGANGNIVYTTGLNTIFISGNSGYFQSAVNSLTINLNSTGANLNTSINNLSGLFTGYTGNLDNNYATDAQLANTGSILNTKIDNLSGYVNSQDTNISNNLASTGSVLQSNINTLSSNLNSTGSNLENKINSLSGTLTGNYATIVNLASTGSTLSSNINSLSGLFTGYTGTLDATFASDIQLENTGTTLVNSINSLSGTLTGNYLTTNSASSTYATTTNLNSTGSTLNSSIASLSGTLTSDYATIINLASTGSNLQNQINNLDNVYATDASVTSVANNLATTGSTLETKIGSLSGTLTSNYATINNLALTGSNLNTKIDNFSGTYQNFVDNLDASYATDSQLQNTGSTLSQNINSLSGTLTGNYVTKSNGEFTNRPTVNGTGVLLSGEAAALPSTIVYTTGDQNISGNKTFSNNIYVSGTGYFKDINISNLSELVLSGTKITIDGNSGVYSSTNIYISGNPVLTGVDLSSYAITTNLILTGSTLDTKINNLSGYVDTQDNSISNNLNTTGSTLQNSINSLSGSSVLLYGDQTIDGTKTFRNSVYIHDLYVTGTEFIANVENNFIQSPYILLNLTGGAVDGGIFFVTGAGLTGINDLGPIIGFDHTDKFKFGISSRGADLSTLNDIAAFQDITAYSGFVDGKYATIINLASTGSTLSTNLASTGSTLQTQINNLGTTYATVTNLASTGSTLDSKINSLSGTLTSTYATISNLASTGSTLTTNLASTGSTLNSSINSLSGTLTSDYATISNLASTGSTLATNLASTGSTLQTNINNLSGYINSTSSNIVFTTGNSNIRGTLNVTGLVVSGLGTPFILKSASNGNSVYFDPTLNGNAGGLFSNYVYSSNIGSRNDDNFTLVYGGGGTRSITFRGGGANVNRVLLDSNGNFGIGSGISSVPSRFYVSGNSILQGDLTVSGNMLLSGTLTTNQRPFVNGTGVLLSGEAAQVDLSTTIRTTGNQTVSGTKDFQSIPLVSGKEVYFQKNIVYFTGNNFTPDYASGRNFVYQLTGFATVYNNLNDPLNLPEGDTILVKVVQSNYGNNYMIFGSNYRFPASASPTLTQSPGRVDVFNILKLDNKFYTTYVKDFAN